MYVFRTSILVSITLENCIAVLCNADFTPCHMCDMVVLRRNIQENQYISASKNAISSMHQVCISIFTGIKHEMHVDITYERMFNIVHSRN